MSAAIDLINQLAASLADTTDADYDELERRRKLYEYGLGAVAGPEPLPPTPRPTQPGLADGGGAFGGLGPAGPTGPMALGGDDPGPGNEQMDPIQAIIDALRRAMMARTGPGAGRSLGGTGRGGGGLRDAGGSLGMA